MCFVREFDFFRNDERVSFCRQFLCCHWSVLNRGKFEDASKSNNATNEDNRSYVRATHLNTPLAKNR